MEKLAILGGDPVKKSSFPEWPVYDDRERQALLDVLESRVWWRTPGTSTLKVRTRICCLSAGQVRHRRHKRHSRLRSLSGISGHRPRG